MSIAVWGCNCFYFISVILIYLDMKSCWFKSGAKIAKLGSVMILITDVLVSNTEAWRRRGLAYVHVCALAYSMCTCCWRVWLYVFPPHWVHIRLNVIVELCFVELSLSLNQMQVKGPAVLWPYAGFWQWLRILGSSGNLGTTSYMQDTYKHGSSGCHLSALGLRLIEIYWLTVIHMDLSCQSSQQQCPTQSCRPGLWDRETVDEEKNDSVTNRKSQTKDDRMLDSIMSDWEGDKHKVKKRTLTWYHRTRVFRFSLLAIKKLVCWHVKLLFYWQHL